MSEQEGETTIPLGAVENQEEPASTENLAEASNEEQKDHEAPPGSEDQGEPGYEDQTSAGVSTSEDHGEPGSEEETLLGVDNAEENQREPGNEDETSQRTNNSEDRAEPANEDEHDDATLPGGSTPEDRAESANEDETLPEVNTPVDQGEPGTGEDRDHRDHRDEASEGQAGVEDERARRPPAGHEASDQQNLSELDAGAAMMSSDPDSHRLLTHPDSEREDGQNVINVSLLTDDGAPGESEHPRPRKPFLGGYRHKLTGAEYHHAAAQTPRRARPGRGVDIVSRDTQTAEQVLQTQQCASSVTTQMTSVGCYISNLKDKLLSPGRYVTADEYHHARLDAVIRLQAHTRRWLSCRAVERLRRERDRRLAWMDLQERRRHEERAEQQRDSHQRWTRPRKKDDLDLLYNALEKWKSDKERQINATLRGAERKAALRSLLEQETQYVATIGRHGVAIRSDNYNKAVRRFLDKSSTPHQWRAADGRLIEMDTPDTIRARQLGDLYDCVAMAPVSREQRMDILLCLVQIMAAHPCQLTRDIVELVYREMDLMRRHVKAANLEGLRKRLSTLFLQFIRTPGFNPEVAKHLKVPQSTSQLRNDVFLCHGCQRYLGSAHFRSCARSHLGRRCLDCGRLKNVAGGRDDFSCYKTILKRLRDGELLLNKDNAIPFMLQVEDIQYLVEVVWGARSALSGSSDLFGLVLVRWERHEDWSPWNCVLLSKDETDAHLQVEDVRKVYDLPVIRSIEHKHMLARRHYNQIPAMIAVAKRGPRGK
ncbi:IQ and ubiquitin-like domain-containing protein [Syngnathoides biaculeatus]|uniref:IQ and ubiquitin-like domain-containing protein n=1 Tax=Syngnathoides biaculeatus TaxID=300417 RepID=UPI002ADE8FF7|nr:IQ and ubiquitin-like domain-containing protein [Syngnathoides biaculeatus]